MKKHTLIWFIILAYGLSWIVEIPLALQSNGIIHKVIPYSFHYLSGFGPLVASLIVTGLRDGSEGLKDLWQRMTKWKVEPVWWLVAVSPLWIYLLVSTALWFIQGQKSDLISLGQVDHLPPLGLSAILLWILTFGIGEETGWRGFALPRLQNGRKALSATILLWMFWAFWHLPLFFYSYDFSIIPGMLIGLLGGAITFTWLYNSTGGSGLITAIWHGLFNYTTACISCKTGLIAAVISALVMVWAVLIVVIFKPNNLSRSERQVI
jgi:membrane protease YdiL (CAAX protease family)